MTTLGATLETDTSWSSTALGSHLNTQVYVSGTTLGAQDHSVTFPPAAPVYVRRGFSYRMTRLPDFFMPPFGISDGDSPDSQTRSEVLAIEGTDPSISGSFSVGSTLTATAGGGYRVPLRIYCYALGTYAAPIDAAIAAGIPVLVVVYGSWDQTLDPRDDFIGGGVNKRNTAAWAGDVVGTYYPQGVRWFEIMSEPDMTNWTAAAYATFYADAAVVIKAYASDAKVITGGISKGDNQVPNQTPVMYAQAIVDELNGRSRPDLIDAFAVHPYDAVGLNSTTSMWHYTFPYGDRSAGSTVREILNANGYSSVPIIATEYGNNNTNELQQATDLGQKLDKVAGGWLSAGYVYKMRHEGRDPNMSLLNLNGTRRAAWNTFHTKALS